MDGTKLPIFMSYLISSIETIFVLLASRCQVTINISSFATSKTRR